MNGPSPELVASAIGGDMVMLGAIARANLPSPQRDHGLVGDDFRNFLRQREIAFDAKNITQIFATFCAKQRPVN